MGICRYLHTLVKTYKYLYKCLSLACFDSSESGDSNSPKFFIENKSLYWIEKIATL